MNGLAAMLVGAADAAALVRMACCDEGSVQPNEGGLALAEWLLVDALAPCVLVAAGVAERDVVRVLAGTMVPGLELGAILHRLTEGAVTAGKFNRAVPVTADAPDKRVMTARCGCLGDTPSGPLFGARVDAATPKLFEVAGLGLALTLDRARGQALLDAVADGLARIPT